MLRSPFRLDFYNHQPDVGNALYFLIFRFLVLIQQICYYSRCCDDLRC
jgi:hypothetical protein